MGNLWRRKKSQPTVTEPEPALEKPISVHVEEMNFSPDDPLLAYLVNIASVIELERIHIKSPTLDRMREDGVRMVVPLVSQGELIGIINLGSRRSEQDYSSDDRRLLNTLSTQAAPALRVAQLARQQQIEARARERIEQELKVARVIQETLLPKEVPEIPGWKITAFWQPAREVSGDFYDFLSLPDGRYCILIADVTDKGVPAALVMATTRSLLRTTTERLIDPGKVLEHTNDQLLPDIPSKMFVTCLMILLDPITGKVIFANAGHNLPYHQSAQGVEERRVSGMPLGLLSGMDYQEAEIIMQPGENLLLLSDGLVEGHNEQREMFGLDRINAILSKSDNGDGIIGTLMTAFKEFSGPEHEQEDDITLVTITRLSLPASETGSEADQILGEFDIPSEPGNERIAAGKVLEAVQGIDFTETRLKQLETAVAEATMNAMEHGNHYDPDKPVSILVLRREHQLVIRIRDLGGGKPIPEAVTPDIDAKLAGLQSPRGWGLFLIHNMVDEMHASSDETHHILELVMYLTA